VNTRTWYPFAPGSAAGDRSLRDLLGGKGANLAEMSALGVPVPPGFTLPTTLCRELLAGSGEGARSEAREGARSEAREGARSEAREGARSEARELTAPMLEAIEAGIHHIEAAVAGGSPGVRAPRFGDRERPLLVSVRSGSRASMPGMMDTVLNLGLNRDTVEGLAAWSGDRRFALDSYRRLIQMFGGVVKGLDRESLETPLVRRKQQRGVRFDHELGAEDLETVIAELERVYAAASGERFPEDPLEQLRQSVTAVFRSWNGKRARTYRNLHGIPESWGTAANVQAMVFGNLGADSATGVVFSRHPATGERRAMGEWLPNAQGEDVVAGIRTPGPLHAGEVGRGPVPSLEQAMPAVYRELGSVLDRLERHFRDLQDVEFTVQEGTLWVLQTRDAKRTALAALRIAVDMVEEELIDRKTAVRRVDPELADQLLHPQIDPDAPRTLLARGLPASPGAAHGHIVFDADEAVRRGTAGESVILVRAETSPEDIHGMHAARAVLTRTGGMTSHAAVVARGMGRTCVVGCEALTVEEDHGRLRVATAAGEQVLDEDSEITVDGTTGDVYLGVVPTIEARVGKHFTTLMGWVDELRTLGVWANADTAEDAARAIELGAEGIGLCRTEHMFFAPRRLLAMREMILASDEAERRRALERIEPMQRRDFARLLRAMKGRPITVRLLDPPLHEFLPTEQDEIDAIAADLGVRPAEVRRKAEALREQNPMLGHRGCRLGITFPEIYRAQTRAVYAAACDVLDDGLPVRPEVMIPLAMEAEELRRLRELVVATAGEVLRQRGHDLAIVVGTMIELPRAALVAGELARHADFFSFGTNDLTQTTMGLSRDDAGRFLPAYVAQGILEADPFQRLDEAGVGKLVEMGCRLGREAHPGLVIGVCGEQGGDPRSIAFFHRIGVDYVSCSPYRVPVARLAAAHAALGAGPERLDV
jgi:pyruvate, orthophosphate dikinase